jgi:hypothetical protein
MTDSGNNSSSGCGCGCLGIGSFGFGTIIAAILSWSVNHSVIWLLIHGFFSWAYIIYHFFKYGL